MPEHLADAHFLFTFVFKQALRIFLISEKIFDAIHGYLKAPEVPLNPKEETPQAE